jgi:adenylate kinase
VHPVNILLIGPPGCGKGTQALRIAERYRIPHISTGDILRAAVRSGSGLGRQVEGILASGGLVGDDLMTDLVRSRLSQPDTAKGFLLDGYPRTLVQAQALDDMPGGQRLIIVLISVPDEVIVRRLGTRRVCQACSITQSVSYTEPEHGERCPYCGGRLARRPDDEPDVVRRRLAMYATFVGPVSAWYRERSSFAEVDGARAPNEVTASIVAHVDSMRD